jgi:glycosyltransferase involved in cell wall biosynthesis
MRETSFLAPDNFKIPSLNGLVLTRNGERLLESCLRSLSFCSEVLVVDSESEDRTRDIAESLGARVLVRPWEGPLPQFRFALANISGVWALSLDQDECVSPELERSLRAFFAAGPGQDLAGCYCSRRSFYFDRFLRRSGWYPDYLLRLFRVGAMEVKASGPHYSFHPQGPTGRLSGDIVHYPYANLSEHIEKINYYTQAAAAELYAKGARPSVAGAFGHGLARFAKLYLFKRGFLDGRAGLILAVHGFFYAFHKYLRAVELELQARSNRGG